ncbi:MAG: imelysin family protein [Muribaculaceae bacterium]
MIKFRNITLAVVLTTALSGGLTSCSDSSEAELTIVEGTQEALDKACEQWRVARQDWEWSEAFLFGAADDYSIDPHTDTWPVDQTGLANTLRDNTIMANIEQYVKTMNSGLLGYHGLEYVLFRGGKPRNISQITDLEYKYMCAVAKDLYSATCVLQTTWAGASSVPSDRYNITIEYLSDHNKLNDDGDDTGEGLTFKDFGKEFKNPGADGTYRTHLDATIEIIEGARDIIGEVGGSKIGLPYSGEDETYIESPYAYNSIIDFYDNILGCQFALYGAKGATEPNDKSLIYFCRNAGNSELAMQAEKVQHSLTAALSAIQAMKAPFALYYSDPSAFTAIDALDDLDANLAALEDILAGYESNDTVQNQCQVINANYVDNVIVATYSELADNAYSLYQAILNVNLK